MSIEEEEIVKLTLPVNSSRDHIQGPSSAPITLLEYGGDEDFLSGVRSGVNGTPTFYINGMRYNGSWDLQPLLKALRSESKS